MTWKIRIFVKILLNKFFFRFPKMISDENYSRLLYFVIFGKKIDLKNPKTFNEHIIVKKLEEKKYAYDIYTDKFLVRDYVKSCCGSEILNEIYGVYDSFDEIDFSKLPQRFALKATHASGFNIIVKDKKSLNTKEAKKKFNKWLKINFYYKDREKNYKNIKPRILCDKYIEFEECLTEYKLYCFNGKVKLICQNIEKNNLRYTNVYDENWNLYPVKFGYDHLEYRLPTCKEKLIETAEVLSKPFDFVRVDLYETNGRIIFSELTFHSGGGLVPFRPKEYDEKFGKFFECGENL